MPRHARDPTTNTLGIAFGTSERGSNMATQRPSSSGTTSQGGDCVECVRMRRQGHRNARDPKFCQRHQCEYKDVSGVLCTTRKKAAEFRCSTHTRCKTSHCPNPRTLDAAGIPNDYCHDHGCPVEGCNAGKVHDPIRNVYNLYCAEHLSSKCAVTDCIRWKTEGTRFCEQHVCIIEACSRKVMSESRPFCLDHNVCRIEGCIKERCQWGDHFEAVCLQHYVPPCASRGCKQKSSSPSQHCELHACQHRKCSNEAKPGRGKPFCMEHKCSHDDCELLRTFNEVDGKLRKNELCVLHECRTDGCVKHSVPDKPYCNSHYCTKQGCEEPRDRDSRFGTMCYPHYESRIRDAATLEAERRLSDELAEADAQQRAEEARRQTRIPRHPREEPPRRQDERHHNAPEPRRSGRQEGYRPDRDHRYADPYEDEGYRSRPGSGAPAYGRGW